jgi:hypothetical protein
MRKPLSIDGDMARRFLDLLDPDHDQFLFAAGRRRHGVEVVLLRPRGRFRWNAHYRVTKAIVGTL